MRIRNTVFKERKADQAGVEAGDVLLGEIRHLEDGDQLHHKLHVLLEFPAVMSSHSFSGTFADRDR